MDSREEEIVRLLTDATNRAILTVLEDSNHGLLVEELAERLVSRDDGSLGVTAGDDSLERVIISLHHKHLPTLDEVDLLEYDRTENVVRRGGRTTVDADWVDVDALGDLLARFQNRGRSADDPIQLVEGREQAYEYGRELADDADDELFLIYASSDLLDDACLPHAEHAIDRGVEFYAGTKSKDARTFFREELPRATVWDPQFDWLYPQSEYPKVSRLIVADREKALVGLWDEDRDGSRTEVAMVGEGAANPLVVLVRELLGPRLDHLDYQSDEFLDDLPFEG